MTVPAALPIGDLAVLTGETVKAIRYWTDLGLLTVGRRPSGYRAYPIEAAEQIAFIRSAQAAGFRLKEIRRILSIRQNGQKPCIQVKEDLERHLRAVRVQIAQLQVLEALLQAKVAWADQHPEPDCRCAGCVYLEMTPEA